MAASEKRSERRTEMNCLLSTQVTNINIVGVNWMLAIVLCVLISTIAIAACVIYDIYRHSLKKLEELKLEQHNKNLKDAENYKK